MKQPRPRMAEKWYSSKSGLIALPVVVREGETGDPDFKGTGGIMIGTKHMRRTVIQQIVS